MPRTVTVLPLALAALLAGCGGASSAAEFDGEAQDVADRVERLQTAAERRDGQAICDEVLSAALRERFSARGSSCAQELDKATKDADDFDLTVEAVDVQGTRATARVKGRVGDADRVRTLQFARERAGWRLTGLG